MIHRLLVIFLAMAVPAMGDLLTVDTFIDFETASNGAQVTSSVMTNATRGPTWAGFVTIASTGTIDVSPGPTPYLTITTNACYPLYTPISVAGTVYNAPGTRGMRALMSANNAIRLSFTPPGYQISVGYNFRFGGAS